MKVINIYFRILLADELISRGDKNESIKGVFQMPEKSFEVKVEQWEFSSKG